MYREYFGLQELPFSIAPNPRYLYLTPQHQEALAHLIYGLNSGGMILLTGEVGTGKTTISRKLLEDIPDHIDIAWIVNPKLSAEELLASICDELSIRYPQDNRSIKTFTDLINARLIEAHGAGRNVVLMIDEAQNLSAEVLEQLRLLTNLETNEHKLLQIVLLGQPELKTMLERSDLRQLAQRVTARYHLNPLNRQETMAYIHHRLAVAGCEKTVFSAAAIKMIYRISHGTPRLINLLCDRAMLGVYSSSEKMVGKKHVRQSCREVLGDAAAPKQPLLVPIIVMTLLFFGAALFAGGAWKRIPAYFSPAVALQSSQNPGQATAIRQSPQPEQTDAVLPSPPPQQASMPDHDRLRPDKTGPEKNRAETPVLPQTPVADTIEKSASATPPLPKEAHEAGIPKKKEVASAPTQTAEASPAANPAPDATSHHNQTAVDHGTEASSDKRPETVRPDVQAIATPWDIIAKTGTWPVAFQTLAAIWHTKLATTTGDLCQQLTNSGLACMKQHANIWLIRTMNRPAIFQITGNDKAQRYGVIRSVSHGYATIQLGRKKWSVTLSELKHRMQGPITLIWSRPPGFQKDLQLGDHGQAVAWLTTQLDHLQGTMIPPGKPDILDDLQVARLKDFQTSQGLPADGIAGARTLMRINELIGLTIPRLQKTAER